jgi:hypothetical protein
MFYEFLKFISNDVYLLAVRRHFVHVLMLRSHFFSSWIFGVVFRLNLIKSASSFGRSARVKKLTFIIRTYKIEYIL